jgi:hypothetical protein
MSCEPPNKALHTDAANSAAPLSLGRYRAKRSLAVLAG